MGRGNVCVFNDYEGLYYIDNDYIDAYRFVGCDSDKEEIRLLGELSYDQLAGGDWHFDELESRWNYEEAIDWFKSSFKRRFKSFAECDEWIDREQKAILENDLFYIAVQDNQWSTAVMLIEKEDPWDNCRTGLKAKQYQNYLDGMRDCLFEQFETLGTYGGPWTSGRISRKVAS